MANASQRSCRNPRPDSFLDIVARSNRQSGPSVAFKSVKLDLDGANWRTSVERLLAAPWLLILTIAIVAPASRRAPPEAPRTAPLADDWRRTAHGWERSGRWEEAQLKSPPRRNLHPTLVASFCLLASIWALLGFSKPRDKQSARHQSQATSHQSRMPVHQSPTSASTRRMFSMLSRASRSTPGS